VVIAGIRGWRKSSCNLQLDDRHFDAERSVNRLAVGAFNDDGAGNLAAGSGAIYLLDFADSNFAGGSLQSIIGKGYTGLGNVDLASLDVGDYFGTSVALNAAGDRLAVGAVLDDGAGNAALDRGAVHLFSLVPDPLASTINFADYPGQTITLLNTDFESILNAGTNVVLQASNDITFASAVSMTLSGQWAGNNLNSSEKYSLGGVYGVRAYPQGEASGDMGSMLNLELAHNFTPQLRGVLFYDYGHIRINRDRFLATDNARTLAGAGLGVNASLYGWQLDSYLAWPLQGGTPLSEPASSERIPRLWMQMSGEF
jgi:hypothetical protein